MIFAAIDLVETSAIYVGVMSLLAPLIVAMIDTLPSMRAVSKHSRIIPCADSPVSHDFSVVVPIYGDITYLQNVEYLKHYSSKIILATTDSESEEFNYEIDKLRQEHGFRVSFAAGAMSRKKNRRSTSSTVRDLAVGKALHLVKTTYVITIDADTIPEVPFEYFAGEMVRNNVEVTSSDIIPTNTKRLLGKLQHVEYSMAMRMRRLWPWLVSGGCHAARTDAYKAIMERHSLFFQGNDVEVGILAETLGYKISFVEFPVLTDVPITPWSWWRQRFAWAGGEWRIAIMNIGSLKSHPGFVLYVTVIVFGLFPFRWYSTIRVPIMLAYVAVVYIVILSVLNIRSWSWVILVYPLYAFIDSFVLIGLAPFAYVRMSVRHNNWGLIRNKERRKIP